MGMLSRKKVADGSGIRTRVPANILYSNAHAFMGRNGLYMVEDLDDDTRTCARIHTLGIVISLPPVPHITPSQMCARLLAYGAVFKTHRDRIPRLRVLKSATFTARMHVL